MNDSNYHIQVNGSLSYDISTKDAENLDLIPTGKNEYHLLNNHKSEQLEVLHSDFIHKRYEILLNGNRYIVQLNNSLDKLIKDLGFELGSAKEIKSLYSPMPGLVLQVDVKAGDEVEEGDTLLILEAMKMENVISSPRTGIIKSINVSQGDAVDKNYLLLEFE
ncbi:MAG: acetyl-CoA carboxylase biotin carboxyl carrier protein subunit [Weeksellaceae bacterium]